MPPIAPASCCVAYSHATSHPLDVLPPLAHCYPPFAGLVVTWLLVAPQPLHPPPSFYAPSGCRVASCCAALLFALASCSIASCRTASVSQCAVASPCAGLLTSHLPLVKNNTPAPGRVFFWMPDTGRRVDEDGSNTWFLVSWCALSHPPLLPPPEIWSQTTFAPARKINSVTAHTLHHKHKHI
jgi:hypothetical protein